LAAEWAGIGFSYLRKSPAGAGLWIRSSDFKIQEQGMNVAILEEGERLKILCTYWAQIYHFQKTESSEVFLDLFVYQASSQTEW
jgi:hypothetical protein